MLKAPKKNMPNYIFIFLVVISPWPILYSFMFYYAISYDRTFNFIIGNKKQLFKCLALPLLMLLLMIYIFVFWLMGSTRSLDIYQTHENLFQYLHFLRLSDMILLTLFLMFILVFWFLLLAWLYKVLGRRTLALYLYFSQYRLVHDFLLWVTNLSKNTTLYLVRRVEIFTENDRIIALARYIWPFSLRHLRRVLYPLLLPYVILLDVLTNGGIITKFFLILPWYYVYSLGKGFWMLHWKLHKGENINVSVSMYGYGTRYDTSESRRKAYLSQHNL